MITTIANPGMPGVQSVFKNMEELGISQNLPIDQIQNLNNLGEILIFGAFQPEYLLLLKLIRNLPEKRKIGFLWTSSPSETELQQGEIQFLNHILHMKQIGEIDFIWFLKPDFQEVYSEIPNIFYAPAPLPYHNFRIEIPQEKVLSLFFPMTLKKNAYAQILAAETAKRKNPNISIQTNLPIQSSNIISLGWMNQAKYNIQIKRTKLALHISHAESNAYGAYEFLGRGIPCLISQTIARNLRITDPDLVVNDPDNISEIAEKINNILSKDNISYYNHCFNIYNIMQVTREYNHNLFLEKIKIIDA